MTTAKDLEQDCYRKNMSRLLLADSVVFIDFFSLRLSTSIRSYSAMRCARQNPDSLYSPKIFFRLVCACVWLAMPHGRRLSCRLSADSLSSERLHRNSVVVKELLMLVEPRLVESPFLFRSLSFSLFLSQFPSSLLFFFLCLPFLSPPSSPPFPFSPPSPPLPTPLLPRFLVHT